MQMTHMIRRSPTPQQVDDDKRACDMARCVWNWVLAAWNRQRAGIEPRCLGAHNAMQRRHAPGISLDRGPAS